jgi:hypothetical protein
MSKVILRNKLLFPLILAVVGLTYLGTTVLSSASKKDGIVRVNNSTHSCELLSAEKHNGYLTIRVQNNSDKGITALVLTSRIDSRTVFTFKEEFAFSEGNLVIAPGNNYDKVISIPGSLNRRNEITLNLSAIFFEDKSSEGDQDIIRDVEDNRLGEKLQLMKALPILDKIAGLSDTDIGRYWSKTARHEFQVALDAPDRELLIQSNDKALTEGRNLTESEQFKLGAQAGKEYVVQKYHELRDTQGEQGIPALREGIIGVRDLYSKMITKF